MIAGRHEDPGLSVLHHFRHPAGRGCHDRLAAGHRVEQRGAEPFGHRAHDEDVERLVHRQHVGAEADEEDVLLEAPLLDLALERLAQLSLAGDHECCVGNRGSHTGGRMQEHRVILNRIAKVGDDRDEPPVAVWQTKHRSGSWLGKPVANFQSFQIQAVVVLNDSRWLNAFMG